ncbi:MAG: SpoIIE family protein phosphatase [Ignavibacteria bacterium]
MNILKKINNRTARILIVILSSYCLILLAIPLYRAGVRDTLIMDDLVKQFHDTTDKDGVRVIGVVPGGAGEKSGIKTGDIIIAINGTPVNNFIDLQKKLSRAAEKDSLVTYTVKRGDLLFNTTVSIYKYFHLLFYTFALLGLGFLIVSFFVGYSRPKEQTSLVFFLLGCSASIGLLIYGSSYYVEINSFLWLNYATGITFFYPLFLLFSLIYPKRINLPHRKFIIGLIFAIPIIIYWLIPIATPSFESTTVYLILSFLPIIYLFTGFGIFIRMYFKVTDFKLKYYLRTIVIGFILGLLGFIYYFGIFTPFIQSSLRMSIWYRLPILLVLAIPISLGYSIFKYKILDTELIVKKSVVFTVLFILITLLYLFIAFIVDNFLLDYLPTNRLLLTTTISIILVFTFAYLNKLLKSFVDKNFYRERYNYRKTLLSFAEELPYLGRIEDAIKTIEDTLKNVMGVKQASIWIFDREYANILDESSLKKIPPEDVKVYNQFYGNLHKDNSSVKFLYEYYYGQSHLPKPISDDKIVVSIPIIISNRNIGCINLGEKINESTFSEDDIDLLLAIVSQTSIIFENSRLRKSELSNKKIQQELEIARNIQKQLIPDLRVNSKNGNIAGLVLPAAYVGGDFFDVIDMPDNKVLLAIADVSGKGLTAAAYMVKVQTYLRIATKIFSHPSDILCEVNKLVLSAFHRSFFVTIALVLIDYQKNKIIVSRAGHNPVMLYKNGKVQVINPPGIALGLEHNNIFSKTLGYSEHLIEDNSIILLFTDGITEAMNKNNEEFGTDKLVEVFLETSVLPAGLLIEEIIKKVKTFTGSEDNRDDIAMLVAKLNKSNEIQ